MPILNPDDVVTIGKDKHKVLTTATVETELMPKAPKAQKNRHLKITCANADCPGKQGRYYVRITERRMQEDGVPFCPLDGYPLVADDAAVDDGSPAT